MKRSFRILLVLTLGFWSASVGFTQNSNSGDLRGTVTDSSGAVMPEVSVIVTNNETGVVNKYLTNRDGLYDTNSILPGSYTIEFSKAGFASFKRSPVVLQVGTFTVDAVLNVGPASQVVQVSADLPLLKTEDAQVTTTLSLEELSQLPNVDPANGWTYLLKLLPGATSTPMGTNGGGAGAQEPGLDQAIGGTMPYFASYLVDGGSIWLPHSANIDQGQSESVAEVNVIATDASAQYGGGGSVFNVISKSGANQFHGSLYENFQNDALDAKDYFNNGAKAKQRFN
ncbi:MAG TPA: carboxypeptidase regulatory-like domain-containing protein, partial [Chthoniobacterales bacterium]|nr:carboxypeptidase regulatory-like domain-containing protein [Chthoniobacterales bacterium]